VAEALVVRQRTDLIGGDALMAASQRLLMLVILLLGASTVALAQASGGPAPTELLPGPRPAPPFASIATRDSLAKPTHWKRGALIGGTALGGATLLLGLAYVSEDDATSSGDVAIATLAAAAIGALVGALIGGMFGE